MDETNNGLYYSHTLLNPLKVKDFINTFEIPANVSG